MFIENDLFAQHVGIEMIAMSQGYAKCRLEIKDHHINGVGVTQGGAVFTLADLAFAAASNSHGPVAVAINVSISFLKASAQGSILTAEAKEISRNRKLASYTVHVTDESEDLVAVFQGMVYIKPSKSSP
jgi:acyl-CoA thioesterase